MSMGLSCEDYLWPRVLIPTLPQISMSAATPATSASIAVSMSQVASPVTAHKATSCWLRGSAKVQVLLVGGQDFRIWCQS